MKHDTMGWLILLNSLTIFLVAYGPLPAFVNTCVLTGVAISLIFFGIARLRGE